MPLDKGDMDGIVMPNGGVIALDEVSRPTTFHLDAVNTTFEPPVCNDSRIGAVQRVTMVCGGDSWAVTEIDAPNMVESAAASAGFGALGGLVVIIAAFLFSRLR